MTPKGHGVIRGRRDLLYDPKDHGDLCGQFDLVYDPLTFLGHKLGQTDHKGHRELLGHKVGHGDL